MPRSNFKEHRNRFAASIVALALLSACAVTTTAPPPAIDIGKAWSTADAATTPLDAASWWRSLGDPTLDRLVTEALARNLDMREAEARIALARAQRDSAAGAEQPQLGASAKVNRRRQSENGALPIGRIPGLERDQTIHDVGFDASWEIDLFGGTHAAVAAADATARAAEDDAHAARISVAAETARSYLTLRSAQREWAARQASLKTLQQALEIARQRATAGDVALAEADRARAQLDAAAATLPALEARVRSAALSLGVLQGGLPEQELALVDQDPPPPVTLAAMPIGERADVLRRRPDVHAAEHQLAAATANVGVANAAWFPQLSISASAGFEALHVGDLIKASSEAWSLAPLISWRIFDGGRVRAEIHAAEARQQIAALQYERAVRSALGDAEQALSAYQHSLRADALQRAAVASAALVFDHARRRFAAGDIALTSVIDAEKNLRDAEAEAARAHGTAAVDLIALMKALGGGWVEPAAASG